MSNRIITNYFLKIKKVNKSGEAPIYLRITVNGERKEITSNCWTKKESWDINSQRIIGRSENARTINTRLETLVAKVNRVYLSLENQHDVIKVHDIVDELKGTSRSSMTLLNAYRSVIANMESLEGIEYSKNTVKLHRSSKKNLSDYLKKESVDGDIRLTRIDEGFAESYFNYLRITKGLQHNSAVKNLKVMMNIVRIAVRKKWVHENPLNSYKCSFKEKSRGYLSEEEIEKLYSKKFQIERLSKVRDAFMFQVYTGLSYSDLFRITKENIVKGIDGNLWINTTRLKTGLRVSLPLLPRAIEILDKYRKDPYCIAENKILPVYCNQRMNAFLKEIAILCEVERNLTTHLARHTFATTITLSNDIPIETVSRMLGHNNIKTTQHYAKIIDKKVSRDMSKLMRKSG